MSPSSYCLSWTAIISAVYQSSATITLRTRC